eukprot:2335954-Amphidinium_carterae.1
MLWPVLLGQHHLAVEKQYQALEDRSRARQRKVAAERCKSGHDYVNDMWAHRLSESAGDRYTHGMPPGCGHAVDLLHASLVQHCRVQ